MKQFSSARLGALVIGLCLAALAPMAAAQTVTVHATGVASPGGIVGIGSDILVTGYNGTEVNRITPGGVISLFATNPNGGRGITQGGDGDYYATSADDIVRITPAGVVSVFANMPGPISDVVYNPVSDTFYASMQGPNIYAVTSAGVVTTLNGAAPGSIDQIVVASDGVMYGASGDGNIYRITTAGVITLFATGAAQYGLAIDGDDNLYAPIYSTGAVLRTTPAGVTTTFATGLDFPFRAYVQGGNLFVGSLGADEIYRIDGVVPPVMGPATVPTLSEWAMILLALGLAGSAAVVLNRRRLAL